MAGDPIAWWFIEKGWDVYASGGEKLGTVLDVWGDQNADIFDGLIVSEGLFKGARYVPSEVVGEIREGDIHLLIDKNEFERLQPPD